LNLQKLTSDRPSGDLHPVEHEFNWVQGNSELGDGYYSVVNEDGLVLRHIESDETRKLIDRSAMLPQADGHDLNADQTKALYSANKTAGFRYSFRANYFVQDVKTKELTPLHPDQSGDIQLAKWSPKYA
jgi:dipeptidyl-peptidase 4